VGRILGGAERSFFVLGCMEINKAFAIPRDAIRTVLPSLHQTVREGEAYWHIHLAESGDGMSVLIPGSSYPLPLNQYSFPVD